SLLIRKMNTKTHINEDRSLPSNTKTLTLARRVFPHYTRDITNTKRLQDKTKNDLDENMKIYQYHLTSWHNQILHIFEEENKACHNHNAKTIHQVIKAGHIRLKWLLICLIITL
ncbi:hypothetical protein ACJX0J_009724, partial [Zea mays]